MRFSRALGQYVSPPSACLLKSVGLAIVFLAVVTIVLFACWNGCQAPERNGLRRCSGRRSMACSPAGLDRRHRARIGALHRGRAADAAVKRLGWASLFADEIAELVERSHYRADPPGVALPLWLAAVEGVKTALLAIAVYLWRLAVFPVSGAGAVVFLSPPPWLLGASTPAGRHAFPPCGGGQSIAPPTSGHGFRGRGCSSRDSFRFRFSNLETRCFGVALMVHMHKRLTGGQSP